MCGCVRGCVRLPLVRIAGLLTISGTQLEFESGDALGSSVESGRRLSGERSDASPHIITRLRAVSPLRGHARTLAGWGALRH